MIFIVFVKMFFFPRYVFFFLSLDAKTLPPPKKKENTNKKNQCNLQIFFVSFHAKQIWNFHAALS